jgi:hypothetical protein
MDYGGQRRIQHDRERGLPRIHINPTTDQAFARAVREVAGGCRTPEELRAALADRYPAVRVRPSVLESEWRWYVFREGAWVSGLS